MDWNEVISVVSNVGFPILCCVYLARRNTAITLQHQQEMNEIRKSIDANTKAINTLTTYIKKGE